MATEVIFMAWMFKFTTTVPKTVHNRGIFKDRNTFSVFSTKPSQIFVSGIFFVLDFWGHNCYAQGSKQCSDSGILSTNHEFESLSNLQFFVGLFYRT